VLEVTTHGSPRVTADVGRLLEGPDDSDLLVLRRVVAYPAPASGSP
jgi:hypothetical protein